MTKLEPEIIKTGGLDGSSKSIACLEVSPSGRILSTCSAARVFLKNCEDKLIKHFFPEPDAEFVCALKAATCKRSPRPSVLRCVDRRMRARIQVNVLPFQKERVRIILFLPIQAREDVSQASVKLTQRETAALELSASGLRRDRIAYLLGIALPTVDMHCRNIRDKLSASTMSAAVGTATRLGLLKQETGSPQP